MIGRHNAACVELMAPEVRRRYDARMRPGQAAVVAEYTKIMGIRRPAR